MKKYLALLAGLTLFCSCQDKIEEVEWTPTEIETFFTFEEVKTTTRTATIKVTPADPGMPYMAFALPQEQLDAMNEGTFPEDLLNEYNNMQTYIGDLIHAGTQEVVCTNLSSLTPYYLVAFGATADYQVLSPLEKFAFFTEYEEEPIDMTFEIEMVEGTLSASGADFTCRVSGADSENQMYVVLPGSTYLYESNGRDAMATAQYMCVYLEGEGGVSWTNLDSSPNLYIGDQYLAYTGSFRANSDNMVMAFAVDQYGQVISQVATYFFKTPKPENSGIIFETELRNLTFNSVVAKVSPMKDGVAQRYASWYCDIVTDDFLKTYSNEEFMGYIMNQGTPLTGGDYLTLDERGGLTPNTKYHVFAFSVEAGYPSSELQLYTFTTPDLDFKMGGIGKVDQEVAAIIDGVTIGSPGWGITHIQYTPDDNTHEYYHISTYGEEAVTFADWAKNEPEKLARYIVTGNEGSFGYTNTHYTVPNQATYAYQFGQTPTFYVVTEDITGEWDADGNQIRNGAFALMPADTWEIRITAASELLTQTDLEVRHAIAHSGMIVPERKMLE